jgi:hypothetical protein
MSNLELATSQVMKFGRYQIANTFAATDASPDLPSTEAPAYSAAFDTDPSAKRHAACDECRAPLMPHRGVTYTYSG